MNRLLLVLFGAAAFVAQAQVPEYVPTDGLLAWYALDGDGDDGSDYQRHATNTATEPAANRFGDANAALAFGSAAGTATSHVTIPGLVQDVVNTFSYAFWANPLMNIPLPNQGGTGTEGNTNNCLLHPLHGHFFGTDSLHTGAGVHLGQNGIVVSEHSDNFIAATLVEQAELSGWHHFVVVYTDGTPSLFIDGEFVKFGAATLRDTHISLGTDPWYPTGGIGNGYSNLTFNGTIDDFGFWSRALNSVDVAALFTNQVQVPGCTDSSACNFNELANQDDNTCVYPLFGDDCETGGAACGEGTVWDSASQSCVAWNDCPSDLNSDGVIGVSDLMSLLADFGTDCPEPWSCGDPVNYHGYDYATVQIGEQCWFAENLRAETYQNGDAIPSGLNDEEWGTAFEGAVTIYGADGYVSFGSENPTLNAELYGLLYNGFAAQDERGLCPTGWSIPTDGQWMDLEYHLGMDSIEVNGGAYRGNKAPMIKNNSTDFPAWNGNNSTGWSGAPGGARAQHEGFYFEESLVGYYWGFDPNWSGGSIPYRALGAGAGIFRANRHPTAGFSIRCVAD